MSGNIKKSLPCPVSAFSPGVRQLVETAGSAKRGDGDCLKAGLLNFDRIVKLLPVWSADTSEYFKEATLALAPVFQSCEEFLYGVKGSEFTTRYYDFLQWTGKPEVLSECWELLRSKDECDSLLALLLITSTLERALGDVYLLRGQLCPSMLKDLLVTQELQDIFGLDVIQLLRVVIGPPISLNIRNAAWHGFPSPGEIPDRLIGFLLLLVPSLGNLLHKQGIQSEEILHRAPLIFCVKPLDEVMPQIEADVIDKIGTLFTQTDFVQTQYTPVWKKGLAYYHQARYGVSLVLLLPQLEHSLRRVFAAVNACPERVLTAEATTLYTTFDEILDKYLPSQEENQLLSCIGENCMDLLFDLLVHPDGPRVRDRVSHGEITLEDLPSSLATAVLHVAVQLSSLYVDADHANCLNDEDIQLILQRVSSYRSLFHAIPVTKQKVLDLVSQASEMISWIDYNAELKPWRSSDGMDIFLQNNKKFYEVQTLLERFFTGLLKSSLSIYFGTQDLSGFTFPFTDIQSEVTTILHQGPGSTLYRGQGSSQSTASISQVRAAEIKESEILGLIARIVGEQQEVMSQVEAAMETRQKQLDEKQLRSRQRDNLKRLIESLPSVHLMTTALCVLTAALLAHLDRLTMEPQSTMKKLQKFLKSVLQYTENMRTFSSPDKNKWVECVDLSLRFIPRLLAAVDEDIFSGPQGSPSGQFRSAYPLTSFRPK